MASFFPFLFYLCVFSSLPASFFGLWLEWQQIDHSEFFWSFFFRRGRGLLLRPRPGIPPFQRLHSAAGPLRGAGFFWAS